MSLIGDVVGEFVGAVVGTLVWRFCHATGRRLIFLFMLGHLRIPSLRHGGGGEGADFGAFLAGLLFWLAALALTIYLLVT